jgi:protease-4
MRAFFRSFFASLLAFLVLLLVFIGAVGAKDAFKPKIKGHSYLVIDVYGEIFEYSPSADVLSTILGGEPETLQRILDNLAKAAVDDRIDGVIMKLSASNTAGGAMIQEIRDAIQRVRHAGKPVYAFADYLNRKTYYLAAACDSIYMPPSAYFFFTGLGATSTHVKKTMEKLGIEPNIQQIREYKSAAELVTRADLSDEAKQNIEWLLEEFWDMFMEAIIADRGLTEAKIADLMDYAFFLPYEAQAVGLIDRVLYWDQLEERLKEEDDDRLRIVSQCRYADVDPGKVGLKGDTRIAVVHAQGAIGGRKSRIDPALGLIMGHESLAAELRKIREDEDVKAVILRVDSPGGESLTSDLISRAVEMTAALKPVVVSMVDIAASGGYTISYRGSRIVANPMTQTGSIGSISGKLNIKEFHEKLGITHDSVTKGPKSLVFSPYRNFDDDEWERFRATGLADYALWIEDIARHRDLTSEELDTLCYGRVWTGRQAAANGLIDDVGGLDRAVSITKELLEIPAKEYVVLEHYPKEKGLLDLLTESDDTIATAVSWVVYRFIRDDVVATWERMSEHFYAVVPTYGVEFF